MNLRRGLFRTWMAVSGVWIIFIAAMAFIYRDTNTLNLDSALLSAVVLPIVLLLIGLLVQWVIPGFRTSQMRSIRRGLFRVWAALSVLWITVPIIAVVGLSYPKVNNPSPIVVRSMAYYNTQTGEIALSITQAWKRGNTIRIERIFGLPPTPVTVWEEGDKRIVIGMKNGGQIIVAPIDPKTSLDKVLLGTLKANYEQLVRRQREQLRQDAILKRRETVTYRREAIVKWAVIGVAPPIILLMLWLLILWSVRGFRSEKLPKPTET